MWASGDCHWENNSSFLSVVMCMGLEDEGSQLRGGHLVWWITEINSGSHVTCHSLSLSFLIYETRTFFLKQWLPCTVGCGKAASGSSVAQSLT